MKQDHITMLPLRAFLAVGGRIKPQSGGGSGSSSPQSTQTTVTNTNIPEYGQPYVESMLGATQQQLFNTSPNANGGTDITGIKPYQPYSSNPSDYIAGFSPLQNQAFGNIGNMQVPGQLGQASDMTSQATQGAMGTAGTALGYGQQGANYGAQGAGIGQQAGNLAGSNIGMGLAGAQSGFSYGQNAQNPGAVQSYMNPYLQATLDPAMQLLNQQYNQQGAYEQGAATNAGAFGGTRESLMQGLNNQNRNLAANQLVSNAYNQAYNTANTNMQQAASLGMQGAQTGLQGLSGANNAYNTNLAGTAQGMQGAQVGLQGVAGAQNAYGMGLQGANQLANIGQMGFQDQSAINQAQLAAGNQQQGQQQNITNQAVQNYATAQQYPQQQLAFMSNMLRGLPLQATTTNQYQAAPSLGSTAAGLGSLGYGAYQLSKKKGGHIKGFAAGGIASGVNPSKLHYMLNQLNDQQLQQKADSKTNDPDTVNEAQGVQAFRAQARGLAAAPQTPQMAGGGIVAFAEGERPADKVDPATDPAAMAAIKANGGKAPTFEDILARDKASAADFGAVSTPYKEALARVAAGAPKGVEDRSAMRFMQAGLGILGGKSPYGAVNIGEGAKPAVEGAMKDADEQRKEELEMAKAQFDVGSAEYKVAADIVKGAREDYNKELDRLMHLGMSAQQAAATIKSAEIHAGATIGAEKLRATSAAALEKERAKSHKEIAEIGAAKSPYMHTYESILGDITDGHPENATALQKRIASEKANEQTKYNPTLQQGADTTTAKARSEKVRAAEWLEGGPDTEKGRAAGIQAGKDFDKDMQNANRNSGTGSGKVPPPPTDFKIKPPQ